TFQKSMSTKIVGAGGIKEGDYIIIDGVACKVVDAQTSKSGKHGHAKIRITAVGFVDEKKRVIVLPAHDNVEVPIIEKKSAQVLSLKDDYANVMDSETYETFDLKIPAELKGEVVDGCSILYWVILSEKIMKQVKKAE
ncbi:MAG: translation initiation factor IF-5A, partial [Nanoarchaeota archaeon]